MSIEALVSSGAIAVLCKPPALGHAAKVVLMEKLASVTFLAQAAEPVFADGGQAFSVAGMCGQLLRGLKILGRGRGVSQGTVQRAERTARGG